MRRPCSLPSSLVSRITSGPGCSSIGGGFMAELGPFFPKRDGRTLQVRTAGVRWLGCARWPRRPGVAGVERGIGRATPSDVGERGVCSCSYQQQASACMHMRLRPQVLYKRVQSPGCLSIASPIFPNHLPLFFTAHAAHLIVLHAVCSLQRNTYAWHIPVPVHPSPLFLRFPPLS